MQYERVDLVVVGGGIMGSMTAWRAARRGLKVALVERFRPGHARGSSHGCGRIYRYNYPETDYVRWMGGALELWRELQEEAGDRLLHRCGCLDLAPPGSSELDRCEAAMTAQDIPSERLEPGQLASRFPQVRLPHGYGALFQADGGVVAADLALQAAWSQTRRLEGRVFVDCQVSRLDLEHERPTAVAGDTAFRGKAMVVAAGPWAPRLVPALAHALRPTRQHVALFRPSDESRFVPGPLPAIIVYDQEQPHYMLPIIGSEGVKIARHGGAPPDDPEVESGQPRAAQLEALRRYLSRLVPEAAAGRLEGGKTCFYTETPDADFVIGPHPERSEVVLLAGFSGHGFKFAPLVGQVAVELAADGGSSWPLARFSPGRESLRGKAGQQSA